MRLIFAAVVLLTVTLVVQALWDTAAATVAVFAALAALGIARFAFFNPR